MKDITGERFGRLTAVKFLHYDKKHHDVWLFQCDCGNMVEVASQNVKWSGKKSCGCLSREHAKNINLQDITGQKFERLTAIRATEQRDAAGSVIWECQCSCGNTAFCSVNALRSGRVHSCGCYYKETRADCNAERWDLVEGTNVTSLINSKKPRRNNSSGYTGVYQDRKTGKWHAYINFQRKRHFLGTFFDLEDALKARKRAEEELHDPIIQEKWDKLSPEAKGIIEHWG